MTGPSFDPTVYGTVNLLPAKFFTKTQKKGAATAEEGIIQFEEIEMIEVQIDEHNKSCRRVTEEDKKSYAPQYEAWKAGKEQPIVGIPLAECALLSKSEVAAWEFLRIRSVEQVIGATPDQCNRIPDAYRMQRDVKRWYEAAKGAAETGKLLKRIEDLEASNVHLMNQLEEASKKFCELTGKEYQPTPAGAEAIKKQKKEKQNERSESK